MTERKKEDAAHEVRRTAQDYGGKGSGKKKSRRRCIEVILNFLKHGRSNGRNYINFGRKHHG